MKQINQNLPKSNYKEKIYIHKQTKVLRSKHDYLLMTDKEKQKFLILKS